MKLIEVFPAGAEVFTSGLVTLNTLDIAGGIDESVRLDSVRAKLDKVDPHTRNREMDKKGETPNRMAERVRGTAEDAPAKGVRSC